MNTLPYTPWKWLVSVPVIALSTLIFGTLALLSLKFLPPRDVNRFIPVWWARVNLAWIPATVTVRGSEHLQHGQSYVVVANHLSQIDILTLYAHMPLDLRWVMKKELRRVPVIGVTCEGLGHIFVNRQDRQEAIRALTEGRQRLAADGASVMFFPEGTRSIDGRLHGFKKGAFVMAKDMNLPILPVTLRGTDNVLPAKTVALLPGRTEIVIHRPIDVAQVTGKTADELMDDARRIIAASLPADRVAPD
jgi:1-acyl-sn-glycerol-3-phosphate acyltransferase